MIVILTLLEAFSWEGEKYMFLRWPVLRRKIAISLPLITVTRARRVRDLLEADPLIPEFRLMN
jgi:hypothetical protein